jgi:hypothetical protein
MLPPTSPYYSELRAILFVGQVLFGVSCVATLLLYSYSDPLTLINTISTELWACYEYHAPSCGDAASTRTCVSLPHFGEGTWISRGLESIPEIRKYLNRTAEVGDDGGAAFFIGAIFGIGVIMFRS